MTAWARFAESGWTFTFATFAAGEVERLTKMPQTLQRAWRSRGLLRSTTDQVGVYTALEVAEILIRFQLAGHGIPPSANEEIGREAAKTAVYFAMTNADGVCDIRGNSNDVAAFLDSFNEDGNLAFEMIGKPNKDPYLWRGDGEAATFIVNPDKALAGRYISYFFLDLEAIGVRLAESSKQPLIFVEGPAINDEKRVRRFSRVHG